MKRSLLTIILVWFVVVMPAQEIRSLPAIISAGASHDIGTSAILSSWRLSQVHVLNLVEKNMSGEVDLAEDLPDGDWEVTFSPNPVQDYLELEMKTIAPKELCIRIFDASGRTIFISENQLFENGTKLELDMSIYKPALYLLQIFPLDQKSNKIFRIQKI